MAEKLKIGSLEYTQESGQEKYQSLSDAISKIETKEADSPEESENSKWLNKAKDFAAGGGLVAGAGAEGIGGLLGLTALVLLKFVEASAGVLKDMAEDPNHPEKWFKSMKEAFKTEKKKEK